MESQDLKSILIVDDDPHVLTALSVMLAREGFDTWTARNGKAALEMLVAYELDLVLMDDSLPDLRAEEILRRVQAMIVQPRVIVMEARPDRGAMARYKALGAFDVIGRWSARRDIIQAVRNCLATASLQKAAV